MVSTGSRELTVLDEATRLLAEAKSLDEIKTIRDKAEAARTYVRAAKLGLDLQNRAAELKLRAERKAGRFLRSMKLRGGDRKSKRHDAALKLKDLGVSRDQSRRWQQVSLVTEEEFSKFLKDMNERNREVTSAALLRIARKPVGIARPVRSRTSGDSAPRQNEIDSYDKLFLELMNHCQLLADVLRPVYEGGSLDLKGGERRIVGRLIGEMADLIRQLRKIWPASGDKSGLTIT